MKSILEAPLNRILILGTLVVGAIAFLITETPFLKVFSVIPPPA